MDDKKAKTDKSVVDLLHNKSKLSSLRTYQGDVANIIRSQKESATSIALKEKAKREERKEEPSAKQNKSTRPSLLIAILALVLIISGSYALFFAYTVFVNKEVKKVATEESILPINNNISIVNVNKNNLASELSKVESRGFFSVDISGLDGTKVASTKDLLDLVEANTPTALVRNLEDGYVLGGLGDGTDARFMVIKFNNFETVFSAMLDWEPYMTSDFSYIFGGSANVDGNWIDTIVKNKDVRLFINQKDEEILAYTFLDKNTVLVTNNTKGVSEINALYASRALVR